MKYSGFNYTRETYADNTQFFQNCLSHPKSAIMIGETEEIAKEKLEFMKRFPPNKEHNRLVAHKADVYVLKNSIWQKKGGVLIPQGTLERVLSIDFGKEIRQILKEDLKTSGVNLGYKTISNEHFDIILDHFDWYKRSEDFSYSFSIKTNSITVKEPKEYHLEIYVLIDGEKVSGKKEIIRAGFKPYLDGKTPAKFSHLIFNSK